MAGELGMVRAEVLRVGKELREGMADLRLDLREGLAELRQAHDERRDEITDLRVALAKAPTAERVSELEKRVDAHGQELAKLGVKVGLAVAAVLGAGELVGHLIFH